MSNSITSSKRKSVCIIGTVPPPVHGMSLVNQFVIRELSSLGIRPFVINLSAATLNRATWTRYSKVVRVIIGIARLIWLLATRRVGTLYVGLSGGFGQIFELIFIGLGRLFNVRIFLHHHSFAYINRSFWVTRLVTILAGRETTTHIVLCSRMGRQLVSVYPHVKNVEILSNAVFITASSRNLYRKKLRIVGFLSNIAYEKGILDFIKVAASMAEKQPDIRFVFAGPFQDDRIKAGILNQCLQMNNIEYVGPKYNKEKNFFYNTIDVLLFPTRYRNEAEPLTIHEAMAHAVPVIASVRGCIATIIPTRAGYVIAQGDDYVVSAVKYLISWFNDPIAFEGASKAAFESFIKMQATNLEKLNKLCLEMAPKI